MRSQVGIEPLGKIDDVSSFPLGEVIPHVTVKIDLEGCFLLFVKGREIPISLPVASCTLIGVMGKEVNKTYGFYLIDGHTLLYILEFIIYIPVKP